ncbi:MAG: hypothetical protein A3D21_01850 [Nitrospirae bacterium RIFCSPHIGHO2_02_FULL_42_12]|nr:MAG: hypothetical protein A3D21_01850 [Nitrospirae bacterium RIFCSPHIGHO2_02_FULL_42_12]
MVAAFARLAMTVIQDINLLNNFTALQLLSGADYLKVFEPDQLHALVLLFLNAHEFGAYVWEAFFGLLCIVLGYLLFKSGYFPRLLWVLMVFASLGYLTDSFGNIIFPNYKEIFVWVVAVTAVIGELPFLFWLLLRGVNIQEWNNRAAASTAKMKVVMEEGIEAVSVTVDGGKDTKAN